MPRKPKLMFQISQNVSRGLDRMVKEAAVAACDADAMLTGLSGVSERVGYFSVPGAIEATDKPVHLGVGEDLVEQASHRALPVGAHGRRGAGEVHGHLFEPEVLEPGNHQRAVRLAEPLEQRN